MNGSICMVVRAEEKTRAEKSHRRWRRGKKGAKKARFRRAWRAKKERHTVYCVERGGAAKGEKRGAMGCIKTPAMKCKISTRSCVAVFRVQAGGKSIRSATRMI